MSGDELMRITKSLIAEDREYLDKAYLDSDGIGRGDRVPRRHERRIAEAYGRAAGRENALDSIRRINEPSDLGSLIDSIPERNKGNALFRGPRKTELFRYRAIDNYWRRYPIPEYKWDMIGRAQSPDIPPHLKYGSVARMDQVALMRPRNQRRYARAYDAADVEVGNKYKKWIAENEPHGRYIGGATRTKRFRQHLGRTAQVAPPASRIRNFMRALSRIR